MEDDLPLMTDYRSSLETYAQIVRISQGHNNGKKPNHRQKRASSSITAYEYNKTHHIHKRLPTYKRKTLYQHALNRINRGKKHHGVKRQKHKGNYRRVK